VEGALVLRDNSALDDLSPITLISLGDLVIDGNPGLSTLENPNLPLNIGSLVIRDNPNLASLNGIEELRSVVDLEIVNNALLADVSALCGLNPGLIATGSITGDTATVTDNPSLPNFEARCIVDDKIAADRIQEVDSTSGGNLDVPSETCACNL
jgi:hypothetical protein